jgi:hypothetical protein
MAPVDHEQAQRKAAAWVPPADASRCYGAGHAALPGPLLVLHLVATTAASSISAFLGIDRLVDLALAHGLDRLALPGVQLPAVPGQLRGANVPEARVLGVEPQAAQDLVDHPSLVVQGQPDQPQGFGGDRRDGGPVVGVVVGAE